ncbi:MAG: RecX family transcriptional regulator [Bacteroidaceae bacterium]|nr:RecX family transcriptional regulator [Bacteroidaceae bacterium]
MYNNAPKKKVSKEEALLKLSSLCATAEYCEYDLRKKMQRWDMPAGAEDEVIERLTKERFIDEERYAHAFVREKFRFNKWGRVRIALELKRKGINEFTVEDALEEIPSDDNIETLRTLIASKKKSVKGKSDYEIRCKLIRFALSRGFDMDDINEALDSLE